MSNPNQNDASNNTAPAGGCCSHDHGHDHGHGHGHSHGSGKNDIEVL